MVAVPVSNPDYRIPVAVGGDRGFSKRNETALRFLLVQAPALRVSGSMQIWPAIREPFVAAQKRYVGRVSP
jgi:hypothetical protein